jgi:hypothetical protein
VRWRRRLNPTDQVYEEVQRIDAEFQNLIEAHRIEGARLHELALDALNRGDDAEVNRIEARMTEMEAERNALLASQASAGRDLERAVIAEQGAVEGMKIIARANREIDALIAAEERLSVTDVTHGKQSSTGGTRLPIPADVRREVWRRDQARCVDCGSRDHESTTVGTRGKSGSTMRPSSRALGRSHSRTTLARP